MAHSHHNHSHDHGNGHEHTHGAIDPSIASTEKGIWAIKWSFIGLMVTALIQVVIVYLSGSVALLADTIHNFGDAATAIPLWIAFLFARKQANKRFSYGFGRVEDLAGMAIVGTILFSAIVAGYQSIHRLIYPDPMSHVWVVAGAALIGFIGNEAVAVFRINVGRNIGSAALIADGKHARVDGLTSLAVLAGALGTWLGYPVADPIIGIGITIAILKIVWDSAKTVFQRVLDGVDPEIIDQIRHSADHTERVAEVSDVRARWIGHEIRAELSVAVQPDLTIEEGHNIAIQVRHNLLHDLDFLTDAVVHIDPVDESGDEYHRVEDHSHGEHGVHSHP
ncbi:MAG: cation diffusion facilitator family transporter [Candidatus Marinimicrobia bacterium]|nr:cation diffusion facilitator family transporter [Candidatus Neomarinimicrobiota bacterium]MCF7828804.1 cation diffusion facilitator family transporter [Candidatus Neomarinimicrobiota bacterium]MCF7880721.1 cation diffusion facilitator family transporter [Candidatus Neomarinimicrobiota bacterium]